MSYKTVNCFGFLSREYLHGVKNQLSSVSYQTVIFDTAQKMKFSIKDIFSKCDQCGFGHIHGRNP